jgi:hypothetical protein
MLSVIKPPLPMNCVQLIFNAGFTTKRKMYAYKSATADAVNMVLQRNRIVKCAGAIEKS